MILVMIGRRLVTLLLSVPVILPIDVVCVIHSLLVIVVQECLGCVFCCFCGCDFDRMREIGGKLYPSKSVDELFFRGENTDFYHLQHNC